MMRPAILSEALGSCLLFATVIGSGIMADQLAAGHVAVALLANSLATGAILFVLIAMLGALSGAHFNPAVTWVMRLRGEIGTGDALAYAAAQLAGGILGVWGAHAMFGWPILEMSGTIRTGPGQWMGEGVATFGLVLTIIGTARARPACIPASVALYVIAAYWFTSSTSFANPAITIARSMTDSFAGIAPSCVPAFVAAQVAGAGMAHIVADILFVDRPGESAEQAVASHAPGL